MKPLKALKDWAWMVIAVALQIPLPWEGTQKKKQASRKHKAPRGSRRGGP